MGRYNCTCEYFPMPPLHVPISMCKASGNARRASLEMQCVCVNCCLSTSVYLIACENHYLSCINEIQLFENTASMCFSFILVRHKMIQLKNSS